MFDKYFPNSIMTDDRLPIHVLYGAYYVESLHGIGNTSVLNIFKKLIRRDVTHFRKLAM